MIKEGFGGPENSFHCEWIVRRDDVRNTRRLEMHDMRDTELICGGFGTLKAILIISLYR
jgi:hypothetical protein